MILQVGRYCPSDSIDSCWPESPTPDQGAAAGYQYRIGGLDGFKESIMDTSMSRDATKDC